MMSEINSLMEIAKKLLMVNMGIAGGERLLVLCDDATQGIGDAIFKAGMEVKARSFLLCMQKLEKSGMEPDELVAKAMAMSDVVMAPTSASLTHTQARKNACSCGARIATMPGITEDMFFNGPINADYEKVEKLTKNVTVLLDKARSARIVTGKHTLLMSLEGRRGVPSTGIYRNKGESGNLPSGEAYIAPLEGTATGSVLIDGSCVGIGLLDSPLIMEFDQGLLLDVKGDRADRLLKVLGDNSNARNLAELGIGTNDKARLTGVILEDEKIYGSVHIAMGSNDTFGGKVAAGVHVDAVMRSPELYLDDILVVKDGKIWV